MTTLSDKLMKKVPREKAFYFFTSIGNYIGESAFSLEEFLRKIQEVNAKSLEFHLQRGDFEKWIRDVLGYEELANEVGKLRNLNLTGEPLRKELYEIASRYLEKLKG